MVLLAAGVDVTVVRGAPSEASSFEGRLAGVTELAVDAGRFTKNPAILFCLGSLAD
jgi:hypothetical protein